MNFEAFLSEFKAAQGSGRPFVVVTLVDCQGSAPQEVGARMIVNDLGYLSGTVGGGKLEKASIEKAQQLLTDKVMQPQFQKWNLQSDLKMSCGGVVSLFFEMHNPLGLWKVVIFGAGHVSQELIRVLLRLECQIICIDPRLEWLAKLPKDAKLQIENCQDMPERARNIAKESFVVLATMGHSTDFPILRELLLSQSYSYIGVLGSDVKAQKMRQELKNECISDQKINSFFCPIGEFIGDNTPAEIAISISAQLLKIRDLKNSSR